MWVMIEKHNEAHLLPNQIGSTFLGNFFMLHELEKNIPLNFMHSKQYDTYQIAYSYHLVQCIIVNLYFSENNTGLH